MNLTRNNLEFVSARNWGVATGCRIENVWPVVIETTHTTVDVHNKRGQFVELILRKAILQELTRLVEARIEVGPPFAARIETQKFHESIETDFKLPKLVGSVHAL